MGSRARETHRLLSLRQRDTNIWVFANQFLAVAERGCLGEEELKVMFNGCLAEPLSWSEMRMLRPLGFANLVCYADNRDPPGASARLASPTRLEVIPEEQVLNINTITLGPSEPSASGHSAAPPSDTRGRRRRGESWDSLSDFSSAEYLGPPTTSQQPAARTVGRPKKKKGRRGKPSPSQPVQQPASRPVSGRVPSPVQPGSSPVSSIVPSPVQPGSSPVQPASSPVQPAPCPVSSPVQPVSSPGQPESIPVSCPAQPVQQPASQPVQHPGSSPVQPAFQPAFQPVTQPAFQRAFQPVTQPASQPVQQPASQPAGKQYGKREGRGQ